MADFTPEGWRVLLGDPDRTGGRLQLWLRQALVAAMDAGRLVPGTQLPASRMLADALGLSRNTVIQAVNALVESGHLEARARSGVWVRQGPVPVTRVIREPGEAGWRYPPAIRPNLFRSSARIRGPGNAAYPLVHGPADPVLFPAVHWREAVRAASGLREIPGWMGDGGEDPALVAELCRQILPARGIWASAEGVMVTAGARQALFLIAQLFLTGGRRAAMEDPGSPDLRSIIRLFTPSVAGLAVDGEGAVAGPAVLGSDVVFLSSSSQFPTAAAMSDARRRWFLDMAARTGAVIVDDDSGALGESGPVALKAQDQSGNVLHVGSLTRALAPGLRIGFVVGPAEVIEELRALRRLAQGQVPANNQRAMAVFLSLGHYRSHLTRLQGVIAARAAACEAALAQHLPGVAWQRAGGAFWLALPARMDGAEIVRAAAEAGVAVEAGEDFFAAPEAGRGFLRLGVGAIGEERIAAGIGRLASVVRRLYEG